MGRPARARRVGDGRARGRGDGVTGGGLEEEGTRGGGRRQRLVGPRLPGIP